ncbi:hypothetical protein CBS101457_000269 [Exobasidium rhododendri]|nr:hypothetical protein CBS101457_000269 [Exobasidium rhododendri]
MTPCYLLAILVVVLCASDLTTAHPLPYPMNDGDFYHGTSTRRLKGIEVCSASISLAAHTGTIFVDDHSNQARVHDARMIPDLNIPLAFPPSDLPQQDHLSESPTHSAPGSRGVDKSDFQQVPLTGSEGDARAAEINTDGEEEAPDPIHPATSTFWSTLKNRTYASRILRLVERHAADYNKEVVRRHCARHMTLAVLRQLESDNNEEVLHALDALHLLHNDQKSPWMRDRGLTDELRNRVLQKMKGALHLTREYIRRSMMDATREQVLQILHAKDNKEVRDLAMTYYDIGHRKRG